ncbi:hypothetical protein PVAND_005254 [Polypedilum vanderplanki]|uniref:Nose resistant-to-fluoxetine protein N-terminal domain-containing protein n=1 Tax=Polypedilum vanderplanki TaxID=319348 RepID=A0A9J6C0A4_POLVA|nr:hypothetical protein PVAND_005254 [Polypedilum vanderplanki]
MIFMKFPFLVFIFTKVESHKFSETFKILNESEECYKNLQQLIKFNKFDKMIETWSNFSKDFTHGNSYDFGDFDKCLSLTFANIQPQHCLIQYEYKPTSKHSIVSVLPKVLYLNYDWKNMDRKFGGAICIPQSCTVENVRQIMKEVFNETDFVQTEDYDQKNYCQKTRNVYRIELDTLRVVSIICLSSVAFLVAIGTILTFFKQTSFTIKIFQCFSVIENFKTLLDFSTTNSTIKCINGIKAICLVLVFFIHSIIMELIFPFSDGKEFQNILQDNKIAFIYAKLSFIMDSFFIVSGVLVGRTLLYSKNFTFWKFLIQRYMRLTLLTLFLICLAAFNYTILKLFSKPFIYAEHTVIDNCKNYWWTTALNIQTFINPKNMCISHAWYASILFQLSISAAIVHLILKKLTKFKKIFCYGFIMISALVLRIFIFATRESIYDAKIDKVFDINSNDILADTYFTNTTKIISLFSGVFLAHLIDRYDKISFFKNEKLNKIIIKSAFYSSVILILLCPFVSWPVPKYLAIIIGLLWIVATNIVIYACHKNYGGIINDFLSLKIWIPISKMALSIYLVSFPYQGILTITRKKPYETITRDDVIFGLFYDIWCALPPTLMIYITIECSITNLANLITKRA